MITDLLGRTGPLSPLRDGAVILDCGSGTGNLCLSISEQFPGATLVAVENDAAMAQCFSLKLADRLSTEPRPGRICFVEADLMAILPWLTKHSLQPDYVFLVNVLYLLDDPAAALRTIANCLGVGGELRLSNPDDQTDLDVLFRHLERDLADAQQLDRLSDDFEALRGFNRQRLSSKLHRLSGAEIRQLVLDAGFGCITHVTHEHYAGQSLLLSARI